MMPEGEELMMPEGEELIMPEGRSNDAGGH
jgi:hypothetical protein